MIEEQYGQLGTAEPDESEAFDYALPPAPGPVRTKPYPTFDQIEKHPQFKALTPVQRRTVLDRWVRNAPNAETLTPEELTSVVNRVQARFPDITPEIAKQKGFRPDFSDRLNQLIAASGGKLSITDGFRTSAQQADLYKRKPNLAAKPGSSLHEKGLAADLSGDLGWAHANAGRFGLVFPMLDPKGKKYEPWHVQHADYDTILTKETGVPHMMGMPASKSQAQAARPATARPAPSPQVLPGAATASAPGPAADPTLPKKIADYTAKYLSDPNRPEARLAEVLAMARDFPKAVAANEAYLKKFSPVGQMAIRARARQLEREKYGYPREEASVSQIIEREAARTGMTPGQYAKAVKKHGVAAIERGVESRQAQAEYEHLLKGGESFGEAIMAPFTLADRALMGAITGNQDLATAPDSLLGAGMEAAQPGTTRELMQMQGLGAGLLRGVAGLTAPTNVAGIGLMGTAGKLAARLAAKPGVFGKVGRAWQVSPHVIGGAFLAEAGRAGVQRAAEGDPWGALGEAAIFAAPFALSLRRGTVKDPGQLRKLEEMLELPKGELDEPVAQRIVGRDLLSAETLLKLRKGTTVTSGKEGARVKEVRGAVQEQGAAALGELPGGQEGARQGGSGRVQPGDEGQVQGPAGTRPEEAAPAAEGPQAAPGEARPQEVRPRITNGVQLRKALQEFEGYTPEQATAAATIMDRLARVWAKQRNRTPEEFYGNLNLNLVNQLVAETKADKHPKTPAQKTARVKKMVERADAAVAESVVEGAKSGTGQKRAVVGGEYGPNGEWYSGGAFIATTDLPKKTKQIVERARTGREEIEPGKWEVPEVGKQPIYGSLAVGHGTKLLNGKIVVDESAIRNFVRTGYWRVDPDAHIAYLKGLADRYNSGERWKDVTSETASQRDIARYIAGNQPIPAGLMDAARKHFPDVAFDNQAAAVKPPAPTPEPPASQVKSASATPDGDWSVKNSKAYGLNDFDSFPARFSRGDFSGAMGAMSKKTAKDGVTRYVFGGNANGIQTSVNLSDVPPFLYRYYEISRGADGVTVRQMERPHPADAPAPAKPVRVGVIPPPLDPLADAAFRRAAEQPSGAAAPADIATAKPAEQVAAASEPVVVKPPASKIAQVRAAKIAGDKVDPRTGMTKTQSEYLIQEMRQAAHGTLADGPGKVVVQVPDDGRFTVTSRDQALALANAIEKPKKLTTAPGVPDRDMTRAGEASIQDDAAAVTRIYGSARKAAEVVRRQTQEMAAQKGFDPKVLERAARLHTFLQENADRAPGEWVRDVRGMNMGMVGKVVEVGTYENSFSKHNDRSGQQKFTVEFHDGRKTDYLAHEIEPVGEYARKSPADASAVKERMAALDSEELANEAAMTALREKNPNWLRSVNYKKLSEKTNALTAEYQGLKKQLRHIENEDAYEAKRASDTLYQRDESEQSRLNEIAKKHFGVTKDPNEAGYVLSDGTMKEGAPKASIEFNPLDRNDVTLTLTKKADFSSIVHELFHLTRRRMAEYLNDAPQQVRDDYDTLSQWAGAKKAAEGWQWAKDAEEKAARAWERYLREGKAPVPDLQYVFARIRDWMVSIYKTIKGSQIDVDLNPEIRRVFDRLLASEEEIAAGKKPADITGVAKAVTERPAQQGISKAELLKIGEERVLAGANPSRIADEVMRTGKPMSDEDLAAVGWQLRTIENQRQELLGSLAKAEGDPAALADLNQRLTDADAETELLLQAADLSLNKGFHRLGMAAQIVLDRSYQLVDLPSRAKAANLGLPPPRDMDAKIREFQKKNAELAAALKDAKKQVYDLSEAAAERRRQAYLRRKERLAAQGIDAPKDEMRLAERREKQQTRDLQSLKKYFGVLSGEIRPAPSKPMGKETGAAVYDLPKPDVEAQRALRRLAASYLEGGSIRDIDTLLAALKKDIGASVPDDMLLRMLSDPYRKHMIEADVNRKRATRYVRDMQRAAEFRLKPFAAKALKSAVDILGTTQRSMQAGMDLSAAFIQGRKGITVNPTGWMRAWGPMLRAAAKGEDVALSQLADIEKHPMYARSQAAGLDLTEPGGSMTRQEEMFAGNVVHWAVQKMPGSVATNPLKLYMKGLENSEAAYTAFLNGLRWDTFVKLASAAPNDPAYLRDVAGTVNTLYGRGAGPLAKAIGNHPAISVGIYAPRYTVAQWEFNLGRPFFKAETGRGRMQALKIYATQAAMYGTLVLIARGMGYDVDTDPRSTDFGKLELPNGMKVDLFAKEAQAWRFMMQIMGGKISQGGRYQPPSTDTAATVTGRYIQGKMAPLARNATESFMGKLEKTDAGQFRTRAIEPRDVAWGFAPLWVQQAAEDKLFEKSPVMIPLSFVGENIDRGKLAKKRVPWETPLGHRRAVEAKQAARKAAIESRRSSRPLSGSIR